MSESRSTHILLYDDHCPLCSFQMKLLTWLDWFNVVGMLPLSHGRAAEVAPGIGRQDLLEAIHCVTPEGRVYRGARAIRFIGMRMPVLVPTALFLWFPGVIWIAEQVYSYVSRNRHILSRLFGCKEACTLLPTRERELEQRLAGSTQISAAPPSELPAVAVADATGAHDAADMRSASSSDHR